MTNISGTKPRNDKNHTPFDFAIQEISKPVLNYIFYVSIKVEEGSKIWIGLTGIGLNICRNEQPVAKIQMSFESSYQNMLNSVWFSPIRSLVPEIFRRLGAISKLGGGQDFPSITRGCRESNIPAISNFTLCKFSLFTWWGGGGGVEGAISQQNTSVIVYSFFFLKSYLQFVCSFRRKG